MGGRGSVHEVAPRIMAGSSGATTVITLRWRGESKRGRWYTHFPVNVTITGVVRTCHLVAMLVQVLVLV